MEDWYFPTGWWDVPAGAESETSQRSHDVYAPEPPQRRRRIDCTEALHALSVVQDFVRQQQDTL